MKNLHNDTPYVFTEPRPRFSLHVKENLASEFAIPIEEIYVKQQRVYVKQQKTYKQAISKGLCLVVGLMIVG